jgi:hypothetical protein
MAHRRFDRDYWLSHADGFAVDAARGRVGVVEEVRFGSRIDRPDFLVVRAGRFGRRRLLVPVEDVEQVRPRAKKLQLRPTADPLHHDSRNRHAQAVAPMVGYAHDNFGAPWADVDHNRTRHPQRHPPP